MFDLGVIIGGVVSGLIAVVISALAAAIWSRFSKEWVIHLLGGLTIQDIDKIKNRVSFDILSRITEPIRFQLRSEKGTTSGSQITFINKMQTPVSLSWFDRDGIEQRYDDHLKPGERWTENTFASHPWVVRTVPDNRPVHVVIGMTSDQTCAIGVDDRAPAPSPATRRA